MLTTTLVQTTLPMLDYRSLVRVFQLFWLVISPPPPASTRAAVFSWAAYGGGRVVAGMGQRKRRFRRVTRPNSRWTGDSLMCARGVLQYCGAAELRDCKAAGLQDCGATRLRGCRTAGLQGSPVTLILHSIEFCKVKVKGEGREKSKVVTNTPIGRCFRRHLGRGQYGGGRQPTRFSKTHNSVKMHHNFTKPRQHDPLSTQCVHSFKVNVKD